MNPLVLFLTALIPLVVGFVWYHKNVFGNAWVKAAGVSGEPPSGKRMAVTFILTYLFSLFISIVISNLAIHQNALSSLFYKTTFRDPSTDVGALYKTIMDQFGTVYRTFKHGALHGTIAGIFFAMPVIAINAMFEGKGFKYVAINAGYWIVALGLMGGVLCAFL